MKWINYISDNTNFDITWAFLKSSTYKLDRDLNYIDLSKNTFINYFRLIFILITNKNLIVHLHYVGFHSLFLIFLNGSAKLITNTWGSDLVFGRHNYLRKIWLKFIISRSNLVSSDAYHHFDFLKKYNLKKRNFVYIPYGTDTNFFKPIKECFSGKNIQIINIRGLDEVYDAKTFILAAKTILKDYPNLVFKLAGLGSQEKLLKDLVRKINKEKNIIFLGFISQKELVDELNHSDIYVSCSLRDGGIAASTSEAMACERITVISNNSDNNKWIQHKENGYLFENSNVEELVNIIKEILNNKEKAIMTAKKARDTIIANNFYPKQMGKVIEMYKKLS